MHSLEGYIADCRLWAQKTFLSTRERKLATAGVLGVILAMISGIAIFAAAVPWPGTTDSSQHLDYAWQLSHGELPDFWKGTKAPLGRPRAKIQFVSHHPPLYYLLLAPIVRPLIDSGHWVAATAAARMINIGIGVLCVLVMAWGGWLLGGKRRGLFAVAVPAIGSSLLAFYVMGDIMNDSLLLLFSTLAVILSVLVVKNGIQTRYTLWLAVVCLGGMATKASFIGTLLLVFLALLIGSILHTEKAVWWRRVLPAVKSGLIVVAVVAVGIGWFYARNYQLSGSPFRNRPVGSAQKVLRKSQQQSGYRTLSQTLTSTDTWNIVTTRLYGRTWQILPRVGGEAINFWPSLFVICAVTYGALAQAWQSRKKLSRITWIVIGLLVLQFVVTYGQQVGYAVGYGDMNRRYLLPAWLPFSLFMTVGALYFKRLRGFGAIVICTFGWLSILTSATSILVRQYHVQLHGNYIDFVARVTAKNDLPPNIMYLFCLGLIFGLVVQAIVFWNLTKSSKKLTARTT